MSRPDELTLLLRELQAPPVGTGFGDVFRLLDALPKGRPLASPAPAEVSRPTLAVVADPEAPEDAAAPEPPAAPQLVLPMPAPALSVEVAALVRVFGEMAADLRRVHRGDADRRVTDALLQVRTREPRFSALSLDRPGPLDAVGLLYVAEAAIGLLPGRWQFLARGHWRQLRRDFSQRLLDLYNSTDWTGPEIASEVEMLWLRMAREDSG